MKTLIDRATVQQVQDFQLEMETFSALQHPNVACLKVSCLFYKVHYYIRMQLASEVVCNQRSITCGRLLL